MFFFFVFDSLLKFFSEQELFRRHSKDEVWLKLRGGGGSKDEGGRTIFFGGVNAQGIVKRIVLNVFGLE